MTAPGPEESARFGEYEIESLIGRGSIGKVYLARHRRIGRRVALKTVNLDQKFEDDVDRVEFHKRLQREAELCGKLQHPNIATLYDVGYDDDIVSWLAIEYVDGESLLARLKRTRPLPVDEALAIGADVLRGLAFAHDKGVIHRDIKPANILITADGMAKIADFGIARPINSSLTATNSLLGTPNYMSPEQVRSAPVTPRSDVFSVGVVMYEMLTGIKAFTAPELSSILFNVVHNTPPPANEVNAAVPEPVARIVSKMLAKSPIDRYASAAEALKDVERARRELASPPIDYLTLAAQHDMTTPLPRSIVPPEVLEESVGEPAVVADESETERYGLRRPVSSLAFWAIVVVLLAALTGGVFAIRSAILREKPAPGVNAAQLDAKRHALDNARALAKNGRYDEAVRAYDIYLAAYPQSSVAREERAAAQRAIDDAAKVTIVAATPAPKKAKPAPEPEQKPPSRWDRVKRWFHRGQ